MRSVIIGVLLSVAIGLTAADVFVSWISQRERAVVLRSLYTEGFTHSQDGKQILAAAPKFEWFFFPSDTWECGAAENASQLGYGCKVKIESGEGNGKKDTVHESE